LFEDTFINFKKSSKGDRDLTVNESKINYVETTKNHRDLRYLTVSGYQIEKVTQFICTGLLVASLKSPSVGNKLETDKNKEVLPGFKRTAKVTFFSPKTEIKLHKN
jgi:hypothetical protein